MPEGSLIRDADELRWNCGSYYDFNSTGVFSKWQQKGPSAKGPSHIYLGEMRQFIVIKQTTRQQPLESCSCSGSNRDSLGSGHTPGAGRCELPSQCVLAAKSFGETLPLFCLLRAEQACDSLRTPISCDGSSVHCSLCI